MEFAQAPRQAGRLQHLGVQPLLEELRSEVAERENDDGGEKRRERHLGVADVEAEKQLAVQLEDVGPAELPLIEDERDRAEQHREFQSRLTGTESLWRLLWSSLAVSRKPSADAGVFRFPSPARRRPPTRARDKRWSGSRP